MVNSVNCVINSSLSYECILLLLCEYVTDVLEMCMRKYGDMQYNTCLTTYEGQKGSRVFYDTFVNVNECLAQTKWQAEILVGDTSEIE